MKWYFNNNNVSDSFILRASPLIPALLHGLKDGCRVIPAVGDESCVVLGGQTTAEEGSQVRQARRIALLGLE